MKTSREELLEKALKPARDAMILHPFYRGKIQTALKCPVRSVDDFAIWYTPGVAEPCKAIHADPSLADLYTNRGNTIAVVSDGTRVLGLGDIGPAAALPVMEGKALLFKYLGGVDAVPICLDASDPDRFIDCVRMLEPTFGGINLEDIAQPKCFRILDTLREEMDIPVWHDDQQGTAAVNLAGLFNALEIVGKKIGSARITLYGSGAANIATARLLAAAGAEPGNLILIDSRGALHPGRRDLEGSNPEKWRMAQTTNAGQITGGPEEAFRGADVVFSYTKPGPDVIRPEWISSMAKDAILFACANPIPEIWPWDAKDAGARIVATGRSDFPNQVNNSLGFPAIFRGTLDVRAKTITDGMCIAAAMELAECARETGLSEERLIPTMDESWVYPRVAAAVGVKAIEEGVARESMSREYLIETATRRIETAREMTAVLVERGIIPLPE
ncbi:MAG: NADP-dependent malic enzyme [Thermovirgaceae bacterium]|nr:NADP-dependent malic enzyme [Thermovirgaceae bacterium]